MTCLALQLLLHGLLCQRLLCRVVHPMPGACLQQVALPGALAPQLADSSAATKGKGKAKAGEPKASQAGEGKPKARAPRKRAAKKPTSPPAAVKAEPGEDEPVPTSQPRKRARKAAPAEKVVDEDGSDVVVDLDDDGDDEDEDAQPLTQADLAHVRAECSFLLPVLLPMPAAVVPALLTARCRPSWPYAPAVPACS